MGRIASLVVLLFALAATGAANGAKGPVVVELFTSQGCYSCPPAERYLGELAERRDVVALEFHVDYWDDLVYGSAGKWKDPFSSGAYTRRQVLYNMRIRGKSGVYTPQMVIGGRSEAVGSHNYAVENAMERDAGSRTIGVDITRGSDMKAVLRLSGSGGPPAKVWLIRYLKEVVTKVRAGENKGKTLVNRNVVTGVLPVGDWTGQNTTISIGDLGLEPGEHCAVLVQDEQQGPIMGAGSCPEPIS